MKMLKLALIVMACLCYSSNLSAQIVQIYDYNDTLLGPIDLSGTVVEAVPGGTVKRFYIKNVSLAMFNFRIERVKIEEADGANDYFAYGSSEGVATVYAYPEVSPFDTFMSPDTFLLGFENDGYLGSHYIYNASEGCSQYRYYVVNDSTERLDSIDVRFCTGFASVEENDFGISVYPNPAQNQFILASEGVVIKGELTITDLSGKIVYSETVQTQGQHFIDVAKLEKGIYIVTLIDPVANEQIFNKKLVLE